MTTPPAPEDGQTTTFDIRKLSEANFRRHRLARFLIGLSGWILCVFPIAFAAYLFFTPTQLLEAYAKFVIVAVGALIGYLCLAIAWLPVRYWARPPVALSVSTVGLDFWTPNGKPVRVPWRQEGARPIELEERVYPSGAPDEAAFSIWVKWGRFDSLLIWRSLVPLTYTTEATFRRVLQEARAQGLPIERFNTARGSAFPTKIPAVSGTVYRIARASA